MKKSPRFSVLLPVFNGEKYLKSSIDSVLSQGFDDFELLIGDDASTDGSWSIIRSYSDPRIKAFKNPKNRGLFKNLNSLLAKSRAPLIKIWSQDDIMLGGCLETEHKFWGKHPEIAVSHCGYETIDELGNIVGHFHVDSTPEIVVPSVYVQISSYWGNLSPNICNVTVAKRAFLKYGNFDVHLAQAGDFDMWARICRFENLGMIKAPLVQVRQHAGQFSRWPTSGVDWAKESHAIMNANVPFIPEEVRAHIANHIRYRTHVLYFHNALSSIVHGYPRLGIRGLQFLRRKENLFALCARWLWTVNGRYHALPLHYSLPKKETKKKKKRA